MQVFISTKRDYANALLILLPKCVINKLLYVQNSVACMVAYKCKYENITTLGTIYQAYNFLCLSLDC